MPSGNVCYCGIPYYVIPDKAGVKSAIMTGCRSSNPGYAKQVNGIAVNEKADSIHFLHSLVEGEGNKPVGRYILQYHDGFSEEVPIIAGKNIDGWWHATEVNDASIAWYGANLRSSHVGIYSFSCYPKQKGKILKNIEMICENNQLLALLGLTVIREGKGSVINMEYSFKEQAEIFINKYISHQNKIKSQLEFFLSSDSAEEVSRLACEPNIALLRRILSGYGKTKVANDR
ncbi:MAG TPA: hypothetical protein DC049_07175 [Spirochaetia bacterium]|nr:hypothetical protein [Spirochaetia bacterium]